MEVAKAPVAGGQWRRKELALLAYEFPGQMTASPETVVCVENGPHFALL